MWDDNFQRYIELVRDSKPAPGGRFRINCMYHNDTGYHCYINPKIGSAYCHHCGKTWKGLKFEGRVATHEEVIKPYDPSVISDLLEDLVKVSSVPGTKAYRFLEGRDLLDYKDKFYVGLDGFFKSRLVMPAYWCGGIYGLVGRTLVNAKPKYKYSPGPWASKIVYNLDNNVSKRCIVMEGILDVLRYPEESVAIFGTRISPVQLRLIIAKCVEVVVIFDSDAHDKVDRAVSELGKYVSARGVYLSSGDPGDLTHNQIEELIKEE